MTISTVPDLSCNLFFRNNEIILEDFQWKLLEMIEKVANVHIVPICFHGKHIVFSIKNAGKSEYPYAKE